MEIRDWILISSAVIVVMGWFVNGYLNRLHEIAKKRMEYRLEALHSFLPIFFTIQKNEPLYQDDPDFLESLDKARANFQLYCKDDEIHSFEKIIEAIAKGNTEEYISGVQNLVKLVRERIRDEIRVNT